MAHGPERERERGKRGRGREREKREREKERERAVINLITYVYVCKQWPPQTHTKALHGHMCILHRTSIVHEHIHVTYMYLRDTITTAFHNNANCLDGQNPYVPANHKERHTTNCFKTKAILCQLYTRFLKQQSIIQLPSYMYLKVLSRSHSTYTICTYMSCIYTSICVRMWSR